MSIYFSEGLRIECDQGAVPAEFGYEEAFGVPASCSPTSGYVNATSLLAVAMSRAFGLGDSIGQPPLRAPRSR